MIKKIKEHKGLVALVIAIVFGVIVFSGSVNLPSFGSSANGGNVTDFTAVNVDDGYYVDATQIINATGKLATFTVGASGSTADQINFGTCNLATNAANQPFQASSTAIHTCAATGVTPGDLVFVTQGRFPTGSATSSQVIGTYFQHFDVRTASSTATDVISVELINMSGAATSSYIQATSTWSWMSISR